MSFKSVNEIFNFDFQDATISNVKIGDDITFNLEALIIEPENSQNDNYTKSYADTSKVKLTNGKLLSAIRDGYRHYDANDKLIEDVADESLDLDQSKMILKGCNGAYLYAIEMCNESSEDLFVYNLCVEFPNMDYDTTVTKSYQFKVSFTESVITWERYMNKV